jgi:hypothetical protein
MYCSTILIKTKQLLKQVKHEQLINVVITKLRDRSSQANYTD